jgi:hypothetical protein
MICTKPGRGIRLVLIVALVFLSSCQYVGDRAVDFADQFRATVGAGVTAGVCGRYLGLVDTGLMIGLKPRATALGWKYGIPLWTDLSDNLIDADQVAIIKGTHIYGLDLGKGAYDSAWTAAAVLPGIFAWGDATPDEYEWVVPEEGDLYDDQYWIWSAKGFEQNRFAQIHAFDIELEAAFFLYLSGGYSPGETVDFLLGLIFIDIAGDDGRF